MRKKKKKNKNNKMSQIIMALIVLFIGIKGFVWVSSDTILILESKNWRQAEATIIDTSINITYNRGRKRYSPQMEYVFDHNGQIVKGNKFRIPSMRYTSKEHVEKTLKKYPINTKTTIYFDPNDTEKTVILKPRFNFFFTFFLGLISLGLIISGIWLLFV